MRIIIFGATGRVGACIVEQAVQAGHDVTAFVRDGRRLKVGGDKVSIFEGDVRDQDAVRSALDPGFDAVVVAIGQAGLKPSSVVTDGLHTIIVAMKHRGIGRLLFISGVAEMPRKTFFGRLTAALLKLTPVGHAIRDHDRAFEELRDSGLKWMLAGGPYIKDGPRRGTYRTSLVYPGGFKIIHPPDVADLIVHELTEERFTGSVVGIWY
jgi:putative NADH-flavin reductase